MNWNMDMVNKAKELYGLDQFKVVVDVEGYEAWEKDFLAKYDAKTVELKQVVESKCGLKNFNPNSRDQKRVFFSSCGLDVSLGLDKNNYSTSSAPEIRTYVEWTELEAIRKKIQGSAKARSLFEPTGFRASWSVEDGRTIIKATDWTVTEGRAYQKVLYTIPLSIRKFLKPYIGSEFVYFDLSAAELTLLQDFSGDAVLKQDIENGFWAYWYGRLGITSELKMDLKRAIYSVVYSASDIAIPRTIPSSFFRAFTERYADLWRFTSLRYRSAKRAQYNRQQSYKFSGWAGQEFEIDLTAHNALYQVLNRPVQFGLANIVTCLVYRLSSEAYVSSVNFDSVLLSGITVERLECLLGEFFKDLGIQFGYKIGTGATYAEAQENA